MVISLFADLNRAACLLEVARASLVAPLAWVDVSRGRSVIGQNEHI